MQPYPEFGERHGDQLHQFKLLLDSGQITPEEYALYVEAILNEARRPQPAGIWDRLAAKLPYGWGGAPNRSPDVIPTAPAVEDSDTILSGDTVSSPLEPCPVGQIRNAAGDCVPAPQGVCPPGQIPDGKGGCIDPTDLENEFGPQGQSGQTRDPWRQLAMMQMAKGIRG